MELEETTKPAWKRDFGLALGRRDGKEVIAALKDGLLGETSGRVPWSSHHGKSGAGTVPEWEICDRCGDRD